MAAGLKEIINIVIGAAAGWAIAYCALFVFFLIRGKK